MNSSIRSLGESTADGVIRSGRTRLAAVEIITDGSNNATVILYDNTAASGTKVFEGGAVGADLSKFIEFPRPVKCDNGLYLDISGTGASCIVYEG